MTPLSRNARFQPGAFQPGLFEAARIRLDPHDLGQFEQRDVVADLAGEHHGDRVGVRGERDVLSSSRRRRRSASSAPCLVGRTGTGPRRPKAASRSWVYIDIGGSDGPAAPCPRGGLAAFCPGRRLGVSGHWRPRRFAAVTGSTQRTRTPGRARAGATSLRAVLSPPPSLPPCRPVAPCGVATSMRQPGRTRQGRRSQGRPIRQNNSGIGKWRPRGVAAILQAPLSGKRRVSWSFWLRTGGEGRAESHGSTARRMGAALDVEVTGTRARE